MLDRIVSAIEAHDLIPGDACVLVAVSGGGDSVLLLHALHRLSKQRHWRLTVAHLDHGLRGAQGADDAAFVKDQAVALKLDCVCEMTDVGHLARKQHQSIEMAGRQARLEFLTRTAQQLGASRIATGHTSDDRIETLLLNLARGVGTDALASIPYRTEINHNLAVVRPLLDIERADIPAWLREQDIRWREDASNSDPVYRRNRVRHELLPWLETRLNPRIRPALHRLMRQAARDREWIETVADDLARKCLAEPSLHSNQPDTGTFPALDRKRLALHPAALRHRVLKRWLKELRIPEPRIDFATIERLDGMLMAGKPERLVLAGKTTVACGPDQMIRKLPDTAIALITDHEWALPPAPAAAFAIDELGLQVKVSREDGPIPRPHGQAPGRFPAEAAIRLPPPNDAPLTLRCRRPGDRMRPTGSGGSRKIQDILTDAKVPRLERARIPLLVSGEQVVWLPGYRISHDWRVTNPSESWLHIRIEPVNEKLNCRLPRTSRH